jgi:hypothetical protein
VGPEVVGPPFGPAREQVPSRTAHPEFREQCGLAGRPEVLDVPSQVEVDECLRNRERAPARAPLRGLQVLVALHGVLTLIGDRHHPPALLRAISEVGYCELGGFFRARAGPQHDQRHPEARLTLSTLRPLPKAKHRQAEHRGQLGDAELLRVFFPCGCGHLPLERVVEVIRNVALPLSFNPPRRQHAQVLLLGL